MPPPAAHADALPLEPAAPAAGAAFAAVPSRAQLLQEVQHAEHAITEPEVHGLQGVTFMEQEQPPPAQPLPLPPQHQQVQQPAAGPLPRKFKPRERSVPSSSLERVAGFAGLGASLLGEQTSSGRAVCVCVRAWLRLHDSVHMIKVGGWRGCGMAKQKEAGWAYN